MNVTTPAMCKEGTSRKLLKELRLTDEKLMNGRHLPISRHWSRRVPRPSGAWAEWVGRRRR